MRGRERKRECKRVRKQEKESGERVSVTATVKQNDSAGLLFERPPACQFQCNIFINTLLAST